MTPEGTSYSSAQLLQLLRVLREYTSTALPVLRLHLHRLRATLHRHYFEKLLAHTVRPLITTTTAPATTRKHLLLQQIQLLDLQHHQRQEHGAMVTIASAMLNTDSQSWYPYRVKLRGLRKLQQNYSSSRNLIQQYLSPAYVLISIFSSHQLKTRDDIIVTYPLSRSKLVHTFVNAFIKRMATSFCNGLRIS